MAESSSLYALLEQSARRNPYSTALSHEGRTLSYEGLLQEANAISAQLLGIPGIKNSRIAVYCPKSPEATASIFAILKINCAYLPLDHFAPIERNKMIIGDCMPAAIILHSDHLPHFEKEFSLKAKLGSGLLILENRKKDLPPSPEDLAYILYTSGSTGIPKGVMYSNSAAMEFIRWSSELFKPLPGDCFSSHAPFHFDLSIFDLFVSIRSGAKLVLIGEKTARQPLLLSKLISEEKISIWYSTPTILIMLAEYGKLSKHDHGSLRLVLFAGEVFHPRRFGKLKEQWPKPVYYNLYGPTETNVCTYFRIPDHPSSSGGSFPIGKLCEHYTGRISEETGELSIEGPGLMLGYWQSDGKPGKGLQKENTGHSLYSTGDIVRADAEGNYVFIGRKDRMVKRHGYRIELAEIESSIGRHPEITGCAVIAHQDEEGSCRITAFIAPADAAAGSVIALKEFSMLHLPVYMIPDTFMFLSSLPQTSSNKTDYQQLKKYIL